MRGYKNTFREIGYGVNGIELIMREFNGVLLRSR